LGASAESFDWTKDEPAVCGAAPAGWPLALGPLELAVIDTPTPFLVLDVRGIRAAYERLNNAFGGEVEVCYAVKCNPDPVVMETLARSGANFEIASAPELDTVIAAGADPRQVLYSNTVKPSSHIASTYAAGVRLFAADSMAEIAKIAAAAPGAGVVVRVSVDDTHSRFPLSSKFGAPSRMRFPCSWRPARRACVPQASPFTSALSAWTRPPGQRQ
jgi:Diaminopimelate decarboxylase